MRARGPVAGDAATLVLLLAGLCLGLGPATAQAQGVVQVTGSTAVAWPIGRSERDALRRVDAETVEAVRRVMGQARALPDGAARRALLLRTAEIKREAEILRLRTQLDFAYRSGDAPRAAEIVQVLERRLHPPAAPERDARGADKPPRVQSEGR
jgi:hypothetical protein